jgi:hypothetical protein
VVTLDKTKASRSCPGTYLGDLLLRPVGGVYDQRSVIHIVMNAEVIVVTSTEIVVVTNAEVMIEARKTRSSCGRVCVFKG